jgi:hypothetical protein
MFDLTAILTRCDLDGKVLSPHWNFSTSTVSVRIHLFYVIQVELESPNIGYLCGFIC